MSFLIDLDIYRGPLDLLLYLVRRNEVEVDELPVGQIASQYLDYVMVIQHLDINAAADFLEIASILTEMKSRSVLPRAEEEAEPENEIIEDPRRDLVRRLLEYKKFKDAASLLEEQGRQWQERFPRMAVDLPRRPRELADEPIHELEVWDLVSALARLLRDNQSAATTSIVYDDTPIHVYMERIYERARTEGRLAFTELFQAGMHKSTLVSLFLAMMELIRHYGMRAQQDQLFGEIWLMPDPHRVGPLDLSQVDNYEYVRRPDSEDEPAEE
jgi:segregation and condensation protein A